MGLPPPPKQKKTYNLYNATHAMQSHAVQPHAVQPHAVQPHAVQPHAVQPYMQCSFMQCNPMQCSPMQCSPTQCNPMQCRSMQCSHMQCSPCSAAQCSATHAFVVLFHSSNNMPCIFFHVISISHGILANFWLMHVDLLIFKYNHTQFCFLAGILTNYYMMKHGVRLTCRLNL